VNYYIINLILLGIIFTISTFFFNYHAVLLTLSSIALVTLITKTAYTSKEYRRLKLAGSITLLIIVTVSGGFLFAISKTYHHQTSAESFLNDQGISKVSLTIKPAPEELDKDSLDLNRPIPEPTPHQPTSFIEQGKNWIRSILSLIGL
jgi:cell division protein FtsN